MKRVGRPGECMQRMGDEHWRTWECVAYLMDDGKLVIWFISVWAFNKLV